MSELGSLRLVLDNKSVEITRTSDLELDRVSVLLDASSYVKQIILTHDSTESMFSKTYIGHPFCGQFRGIA